MWQEDGNFKQTVNRERSSTILAKSHVFSNRGNNWISGKPLRIITWLLVVVHPMLCCPNPGVNIPGCGMFHIWTSTELYMENWDFIHFSPVLWLYCSHSNGHTSKWGEAKAWRGLESKQVLKQGLLSLSFGTFSVLATNLWTCSWR